VSPRAAGLRSGSHAALAFIASLVAVPLGIGLYLGLFQIAGDTTEAAVIAPWWSLALIPVGTVLLVVAATSLPAWLATRIHTADALRYGMTVSGCCRAQGPGAKPRPRLPASAGSRLPAGD
jgi:hypothetical protein